MADREQDWIAKYRAALEANPIEKPRSSPQSLRRSAIRLKGVPRRVLLRAVKIAGRMKKNIQSWRSNRRPITSHGSGFPAGNSKWISGKPPAPAENIVD